MRLHHFGISVPDLDETVQWYREKLGFELLSSHDIEDMGARVVFLGRDGFRVEIFWLRDSSPMPDSRWEPATDLSVQGLKHITLAVDDLEAVVDELKGREVEFAMPALEVQGSGGELFAFFRDNSGILIELYQPVAENEAASR